MYPVERFTIINNNHPVNLLWSFKSLQKQDMIRLEGASRVCGDRHSVSAMLCISVGIRERGLGSIGSPDGCRYLGTEMNQPLKGMGFREFLAKREQ